MSQVSTPRAAAALLTLVVGLVTPVLPIEAQALPSSPMADHASARAGPVVKPAPDFARTDVSGHGVRLSNFRGKVVLLNFWATWCAPCLDEIPTFSAWQQKYGSDGLQVLGVSMDDGPTPVTRAIGRY